MKKQMVAAIAKKADLTKVDSEKAYDAILEVFHETLASGGELNLIGFASLKVVQRAERTGRNPQTGDLMTIPASKTIRFKAGKLLKDAVNGK